VRSHDPIFDIKYYDWDFTEKYLISDIRDVGSHDPIFDIKYLGDCYGVEFSDRVLHYSFNKDKINEMIDKL
jgi:hypothetical protein